MLAPPIENSIKSSGRITDELDVAKARCHATNFRTMELLRLCMMGTRTRSRVPITAVRFKCTQKGTAILEEKLLEQTLRPRSSTSALYLNDLDLLCGLR